MSDFLFRIPKINTDGSLTYGLPGSNAFQNLVPSKAFGFKLLTGPNSYGHAEALTFLLQQTVSNNLETITLDGIQSSAYKFNTPINVNVFKDSGGAKGDFLQSVNVTHRSAFRDNIYESGSAGPDGYVFYYNEAITNSSPSGNNRFFIEIGNPLDIASNQLASSSLSSVVDALESDFGLDRTTGSDCLVTSLDSISEKEEDILKRAYIYKSAAAGNSEYKTIVDNLHNAVSLTKQNLSTSNGVGSSSAAYTSGSLAQYKISVNSGSNFHQYSTSSINSLNEIKDLIMKNIAMSIINLSPGIKNSDISSVVSAKNSLTEPSVNKTIQRSCCDAFISGQATSSINRSAGVYNVNQFIELLQDATDGGQHIASMLDGILTSGNGKLNVLNVSGNADNATMFIGIRRNLQNSANPGFNQEIANSSSLINALNDISENAANAAVGLIKSKLLKSKIG